MFAEKAFELIKELDRSPDTLPPFNDEIVRQVLSEMNHLFFEGQNDGDFTLQLRHAAGERNKRCLLAYLNHRMQIIRKMRWEFGSILPAEVKMNMSSQEYKWFASYSKALAIYMGNIGGDSGLNLTQDMKPPKALHIEVKCLVDFGRFELDTGEVILLKKNGIHLLPRAQCETLIRQGVLEHIG